MKDLQVRWFYREPDSKHWTPFNGFDSLNLENKFREQHHVLSGLHSTSSWPLGLENFGTTNGSTRSIARERSPPVSNPFNVPVLCGMFDVNLKSLLCHPVYWSENKDAIRVYRGTWFKDLGNGTYEPLVDDNMVSQIELTYRNLIAGPNLGKESSTFFETQPYAESSGLNLTSKRAHTTTSAPSLLRAVQNQPNEPVVRANSPSPAAASESNRKRPIHTLKFPDCHVDFYSAEDVYLYQDSTSLYIRQKLGMPKVGIRLRRGYKEAACLEDRPPEVTHLCFVIHGIGQKMGLYSINRCVGELRETCNKLIIKHFSGPEYLNKRVEFLPVQWRSSLQLDGNIIESITPSHIRGLRSTLNSSAMDIMYYTSPLYRSEMLTNLSTELNRLYALFAARNPLFSTRGGKVSVLAHSLGCVLIYDLITGYNQPVHDQLNQLRQTMELARTQEAASSKNNVEHGSSTDSTESSTSTTSSSDSPSNSTGNLVGTSDYRGMDNAQKRQYISSLGLRLEAARAEVTRIERELSRIQSNGGSLAQSSSSSRRDRNSSRTRSSVAASSSLSSHFSSSELLFKQNLENIFFLGSPLPVYLVLRGVSPGLDTTQDSILPRSLCPRIFNIYHPSDPVAYRLEPLILRHYSVIQPALIHRFDAGNKPDYDELPLITIFGREIQRQLPAVHQETDSSEDSENRPAEALNQHATETVVDGTRPSIANLVLNLFRSPAADPVGTLASETAIGVNVEPDSSDDVGGIPVAGDHDDDDDDESKTLCATHCAPPSSDQERDTDDPGNRESSESNSSFTHVVPQEDPTIFDPAISATTFTDFSLQLEHRLDFELRVSRYENMYLSILSAHTGYWSNSDICMFVLTRLLND